MYSRINLVMLPEGVENQFSAPRYSTNIVIQVRINLLLSLMFSLVPANMCLVPFILRRNSGNTTFMGHAGSEMEDLFTTSAPSGSLALLAANGRNGVE
jgi:hypothetical protein